MENTQLDKLFRAFSVELPYRDTMEEYLETILPVIRPWSEDLLEEEFFIGKAWQEIRDNENFHETVLHFFNEGNEYLQSVDGNVHKGLWRLMPPGSNKILVEQMANGAAVKSELYDLAYLDDYFFILKKHGDQERKGRPRFFVMGFEPTVGGLEWRDTMELLFNKYRSNNQFYRNIFILVVLIVIIIALFSLF